jgi:hydrogenase/urease accessory protein HupE
MGAGREPGFAALMVARSYIGRTAAGRLARRAAAILRRWKCAPASNAVRAILLVGLVSVALCRAASAHLGGHTGYASISIDRQQVRYSLQLSAISLPPALADQMKLGQPGLLPDLKPLVTVIGKQIKLTNNGRACEAGPGFVVPPPPDVANIVLVVDFVCADQVSELTIRDDLFDVLGNDYHTLARVEWPGGSAQFAFQSDARDRRVQIAKAESSARGAGSFFLLGIEHILTGYDHLLFLLALVLRGGNIWSLLKIITAFTVAHSITLALAALNIVILPERLVEATIALSIAYVAAENLFMRHAVSHRWAVAFIFGLMHGFGFSNVLRELGLPKQGLVWTLLNFNLGVEAGQAIAVVIAVPLLMWLRRYRWEPRAVAAVSMVVLMVGLVLFVDRAFLTSAVRVQSWAYPYHQGMRKGADLCLNVAARVRVSIAGPLKTGALISSKLEGQDEDTDD